jgi:hypothetical protein
METWISVGILRIEKSPGKEFRQREIREYIGEGGVSGSENPALCRLPPFAGERDYGSALSRLPQGLWRRL